MLKWLLRFLLCAFVLVVVVYVTKVVLRELGLPYPVDILAMLIVGVLGLLAVCNYLGLPPESK